MLQLNSVLAPGWQVQCTGIGNCLSHLAALAWLAQTP